MSKIILVTGGARSGKSTFAEKYATSIKGRTAYIAAAQIFDEEMAYRVKLHQSRRSPDWQTFETPFNADETINNLNGKFDVILFDCLTLYISNYICRISNLDDIDAITCGLKDYIELLIAAAKNFNGTVIFVTNEVGSGIVPENKLARVYRDCAGIVNQMFAAVASEVYLVTAGIAIDIKKLAYNFSEK